MSTTNNSQNSKNPKNKKHKFLLKLLIIITLTSTISTNSKINFDKFLDFSNLSKNQSQKNKKIFTEETKSLTLKKILSENGPNLDKFSTDMAKYFLKIAAYSYCSEENMLNKNCCSDLFTNDKWELFSSEKVQYDNYQYAILINKNYKKIAVTFPGTISTTQLIKELYYSNGVAFEKEETEKTMEYLKFVYSQFNENLEKNLEKLFLEFVDYQFIFTGHSLGGSMAAISIFYSVKYGKLKKSTEPVLITYGQARTGNDIFANELMKNVEKIYRVTRRGDLVSSIPPCSWTFENWGLECNTILPQGKFDKDFELSDSQRKIAKENFYTWHNGGWYSFNDGMDYYKNCGVEYTENNKDPDCQYYTSYFDISKHKQYFGIAVGDYCDKN